MTKEAMIKVLRYKAEHIKAKIRPECFAEVADMLEQQSCEDTISRQDTMKTIIKHLGIRSEEYLLPAEKAIYKIVKICHLPHLHRDGSLPMQPTEI